MTGRSSGTKQPSRRTTASRGQFHEHFTSSFYVHRSQKRKKTDGMTMFFALLESACVKAFHKKVGEIDPRAREDFIFVTQYLLKKPLRVIKVYLTMFRHFNLLVGYQIL